MGTKKNDGGQAFPSIEEKTHCAGIGMKPTKTLETIGGMTLRQYYVGQALIGLSSDFPIIDQDPSILAESACRIADAAIKAEAES